MPERAKAVCAMVNHLEGGVSFNSIDEIARLGPADDKRDIPIDEYYERYDGAFVAAIDRIDWNRVMIEAWARHTALGHDTDEDEFSFPHTGHMCPECLCEALLSSGYQNWEREPTASRTRLDEDRL